MDTYYFAGVDVSKNKLDFCIMLNNKIVSEKIIKNQISAIVEFLTDWMAEANVKNDQILVCAEHTGQYTYPLTCACKTIECRLWLENPSQIKYSSGVKRGKNDKIDAQRIAVYASRFCDQIKYYNRPIEQIERLKQLEGERNMYVTDMGKYKGQLKDQKEFMPLYIYEKKASRLIKIIEGLKAAIDSISLEMNEIIKKTPMLARQMKLLTSVDGVGPVVAINMIIATEAFTLFDDPRKFCCYAGVAPFSYTSGSSQHSKNKVSNKADKNIKRLLHLAALTIISKPNCEMKIYFERKVAEGKNKMTVINAIRGKIVSRMFAVIKNNRPYLPLLCAIP